MSHICTLGIGPMVVLVDRHPSSVQLLVYTDGIPRIYETPFPPGAGDNVALIWALDLAVQLGAMSEVVVLRTGSIGSHEIKSIVLASRTIKEASGAD